MEGSAQDYFRTILRDPAKSTKKVGIIHRPHLSFLRPVLNEPRPSSNSKIPLDSSCVARPVEMGPLSTIVLTERVIELAVFQAIDCGASVELKYSRLKIVKVISFIVLLLLRHLSGRQRCQAALSASRQADFSKSTRLRSGPARVIQPLQQAS